jgi:hypothetical protein
MALFELFEFHPARPALAIAFCVGLTVAALILAIRGRHRGAAAYRKHFSESRRERQFLAAVGFYISFALIRFITHSVRAGRGPFHDISIDGRHLHHLVFGIVLLLVVGYGWLLEIGSGRHSKSRWTSRVMSILFGVGAALTLDEYALWLNLRDVYWEREGRASIDAVLLFGSLLMIGILGGPFLRALVHEVRKKRARRAKRRGVKAGTA